MTFTGRYCFQIMEKSRDEKGYIPVLIQEGMSGYTPLSGNGRFASPWYWGTEYADACAVAAKANADLGLTPEDVKEIIASSYRSVR